MSTAFAVHGSRFSKDQSLLALGYCGSGEFYLRKGWGKIGEKFFSSVRGFLRRIGFSPQSVVDTLASLRQLGFCVEILQKVGPRRIGLTLTAFGHVKPGVPVFRIKFLQLIPVPPVRPALHDLFGDVLATLRYFRVLESTREGGFCAGVTAGVDDGLEHTLPVPARMVDSAKPAALMAALSESPASSLRTSSRSRGVRLVISSTARRSTESGMSLPKVNGSNFLRQNVLRQIRGNLAKL